MISISSISWRAIMFSYMKTQQNIGTPIIKQMLTMSISLMGPRHIPGYILENQHDIHKTCSSLTIVHWPWYHIQRYIQNTTNFQRTSTCICDAVHWYKLCMQIFQLCFMVYYRVGKGQSVSEKGQVHFEPQWGTGEGILGQPFERFAKLVIGQWVCTYWWKGQTSFKFKKMRKK